jgi:hypothetical protein
MDDVKVVSAKEFNDLTVKPKGSPSVQVQEQFELSLGLSRDELLELEEKASMPVNLQRALIAKLSAYIDFCMAKDLREKGFITDYSRRFIELYNTILQNTHKELYGEKQITMGHVRVTHSAVMQKVREFSNVVDVDFVDSSKPDADGGSGE